MSRVKWSNPEKVEAPPLGVVDIEKGAFWSPSTMVANFTFYLFLFNLFNLAHRSQGAKGLAVPCYLKICFTFFYLAYDTKKYPVVWLQFWSSVECKWFGLVWFYGILIIEGYLIPNTVHTKTLNIYNLKTFCWQHFEMNLSSFFCTQLNGFRYSYLIQIALFTINHLFAHN